LPVNTCKKCKTKSGKKKTATAKVVGGAEVATNPTATTKVKRHKDIAGASHPHLLPRFIAESGNINL
jgi:hypothetical protein